MSASTFPTPSSCTFDTPDSCSRGGAAKWHVVWCHEWIHKADLKERRRSITNAVEASGGVLHCLNKATTFEKWLSTSKTTEPYVLLTNWRLTKPCVDVLLRTPQAQQPTMTVVHCDNPSYFPPASAWAQKSGSSVRRLYVSDSLNFEDNFFARGFFGGLVKQVFDFPMAEAPSADSLGHVVTPVAEPQANGAPVTRFCETLVWPAVRQQCGFFGDSSSSASTCSPTWSPPASPHASPSLCSTPRSFVDFGELHPDLSRQCSKQEAPSFHCFDACVPARSISISDELELFSAQGWRPCDAFVQCTNVNAMVLTTACQALMPCNAKEIEALLVQAMPDHYHD